ncbi:magnesium transporter [Clostridium sp. chh4-2]|uniref:magnesium transporter n=1 Tax=Clostridium sp. chh4-2 TaxID=2067550 RepID=UPI000CCF5446|nr:magnesium transporter [Clostridium sp. chh4-2]PNV62758.1 magnesium transporter [Clostridium sp. chh4-2]
MREKKAEEIIELLQSADKEAINDFVNHVHPADVLEAVIGRGDIHDLLNGLPKSFVAEIIEEADEEEQIKILQQFTNGEKSEILNSMASDDVADLIDELAGDRKSYVIGLLDGETRKDVEKLLTYDSETAGGIMTTEFLAIYEDKTIESALKYIRSETDAETTYYLYVIDREYHLRGVVTLRDIVSNELTTLIKDIMNPNVISVHYNEDQEEVSRTFEKYGFMLMPVIDDENRMIGVITVDDILEIMIEETTEDIHRMAGINKEEKVDGSVSDSIRSRLPWLIVNLATALLASAVIDLFSDTISKIVALSAVMTIISGMGGNAGTQTLTIIVRGLSLGEVDRENAVRILIKEVLVGLATGIVIGVFVAGIAMFYEFNPLFGLVAAVAMMLNMLCASVAGYAIPILLEKLKIDPALASGVFVTTFTDVLGFFFFLGLATVAMPYL